MTLSEHKSRRKFGQHFTSRDIFEEYVLPLIKDKLNDYIFVDMFCGSGNLILPILDEIIEEERVEYFRENIYLFDVQEKWIKETINNAVEYGIPEEIAEKNIILRDTLKNYPKFLLDKDKEIFHITNPPYLYLGYIVKTEETQKYLPLFEGKNDGYQDLYQIGLINDLRNNLQNMIYIIPSNFIFGNSVSNKIRNDFFPKYTIKLSYIFEKKIFEHTGQNVMINHFIRKSQSKVEPITFKGIKLKKDESQDCEKEYILYPKYNYKAGSEFEEFVDDFKPKSHLKLDYYLKLKDVKENPGMNEIDVIDANNYKGNAYVKEVIEVNDDLARKIKENILWIRTVDTGSWEGRAGLYLIKENFDVDGILVTKNTYRTNPIQIFFKEPVTIEDQILLKDYFNFVLEYLRSISDSEFMTTYKYSNGPYTRKYFGLSQGKKLIHTFPKLNSETRIELRKIIDSEDIEKLKSFLESLNKTNKPVKKPAKKLEIPTKSVITDGKNKKHFSLDNWC